MEYLVNNTPNVRENTMLQVFLVAQQVLNCAPACVSLIGSCVFFKFSADRQTNGSTNEICCAGNRCTF